MVRSQIDSTYPHGVELCVLSDGVLRSNGRPYKSAIKKDYIITHYSLHNMGDLKILNKLGV